MFYCRGRTLNVVYKGSRTVLASIVTVQLIGISGL